MSRRHRWREGDVTVRVRFSKHGRSYAYRVRGPVRLGSRVEVEGRLGPTVLRVVGFGRGLWFRRLKRGQVVR